MWAFNSESPVVEAQGREVFRDIISFLWVLSRPDPIDAQSKPRPFFVDLMDDRHKHVWHH